MPRATSQDKNEPTDAAETPKAVRKSSKAAGGNGNGNGNSNGAHNGAAHAAAPAGTSRKASSINRSSMLDNDGLFDTASEQDLAAFSSGADMQGLDDLDVTERFDLGETGRSRTNRSGDSLVAALDEIYDTLSLTDSELPPTAPPSAKGKRGSKRNNAVDSA